MGRFGGLWIALASATLLGWGAWPAGAWGQYYPGVGARIVLTDVPAGAETLIPRTDPMFGEALKASGLKLEGLIRLQPGLSRKYERYVVQEGEPWAVTEQVLAAADPPAARPAADQVDYTIDGQPILLGVGMDPMEGLGWQVYAIATFLPQADGSLVELGRWQAGAEYSEGIYLLDLNSDGVLEVVMPWATGVAGGGGIEVVAIVPTGGIAGFGDTEAGSSLYSTLGDCSLLDYDLDGNWEIETTYPVLANWASYYYSDLMVFDPKKWAWVSGELRFPEYYATEKSFYRQLNLFVQRFAREPEVFRTDKLATDFGFACEIGGEWYSLDPFCMDAAGTPDQQMVDWLAGAVTAMEPEEGGE